MPLIAEVTASDGTVHARIYSPHAGPRRTLTIEEGNRGFDQTYARWDRLFTDRYAGVAYYFGASY